MPHWTNLVKSSLSKGEILPVRVGGGVPQNKYSMTCKKLNTTFDVTDINKLEEYIRYNVEGSEEGISYSNFTANDTVQFYSVIPKQYRDKFSISLMQVTGNVPPHTDSGVTAVVNFYVTTNNCITEFYKLLDTDAGAFQVANQTNGFVFNADKLTLIDSFQAEPGDVWVLDVSKPHAVISNTPADTPRLAICLSTNTFSYTDLLRLLNL